MPLSSNLVDFLDTAIDSFEKLEIARALRDRQPVRLDALRAQLQLENGVFVGAVTALVESGLVITRDGIVTLGPRASEPTFGELMAAYDEDRFAIAAALSKIAMNRMRTMTARAFSNAFVFKKPRRDGDG